MKTPDAFKPARTLTFETAQTDLVRLRLYVKNNKSSSLYFDLGGITHCDSAGLALLIEAKRLAKQCEKKLMIMSMPDKVQQLAEFCGVLALLLENEEG